MTVTIFYSVQRRNAGIENANFFAREENRTNFLCGHPHGFDPLHLSACVHLIEPDPSSSVWTS